MSNTRRVNYKEHKFGPFLIKYWASGSDNTFVGIAKVPFRSANMDWDEPFETIKIYSTSEEAEHVVLEGTKERLRQYCKEFNIELKE